MLVAPIGLSSQRSRQVADLCLFGFAPACVEIRCEVQAMWLIDSIEACYPCVALGVLCGGFQKLAPV